MKDFKRFEFRFNELKKGNNGTKLDVSRILLKDYGFQPKEVNQLLEYPKFSKESSIDDFEELLEFASELR